MTLQIHDKAPDFSMPTDEGQTITLSDLKGQAFILYFYPKDNTPGCTKQACTFSEQLPEFEKLGVRVIGVSKDSLKKHENFRKKHDLKITLASDENNDVCERYGVWKEKSMYGKQFMGIERTTFLIDETGAIKHIWPKVKVAGHIENILEKLK